ncbi:hypothetical protein GCM10010116_14900 [Microbispora rosea subsp. aerata]|nr:hypothetical protein GCM10010116_14900 [Microbispora rosea subsp. aerata]GIH53190.1 hypothetical protein Mro02_01040 [Microbispora rosea subsp. aerata]GLJ83898.1 hypothetical protein GCM10017588_26260 [Microbispora rosea subsp. aerata]
MALGINSKTARHIDQLHIHMAQARPESLNDLVAQDHLAATRIDRWAKAHVSIHGYSEQYNQIIPHTYRVLIWPGFTHDNLFAMLRTMLVYALGPGGKISDAKKIMQYQTLMVIPRPAGGYYIINSEKGLRDQSLVGTDTCDPLLLMHP